MLSILLLKFKITFKFYINFVISLIISSSYHIFDIPFKFRFFQPISSQIHLELPISLELSANSHI